MRYIIGIDLGTTNSSVAYVDTQKAALAVQLFSIPQLTAPGRTEASLTLPSFCYLASPGEWTPGALQLPWKEETTAFVGQLAKIQGSRVPTRLIQSAKSWLCNVAANRRDKILPLEAADPSQRLSPIEASAKYLMHIRDAWNATLAKNDVSDEFEEQEIILTVPASFDEVARALTIEAARQAGLQHLTLLEEPQAAFYSWIAQHEDNWQQQLKAGETILICDVGGGTTDFSLIEVQAKGEKLAFQRMAVGDHLLLGGDNMDVALAHYLEQKLQKQGHTLQSTTQWLQLKAEARNIKEEFLSLSSQSSQTQRTITLQGTGSSVIQGSVSVSIQRSEVEDILNKGFFEQYDLPEALQLRRSRGVRTMGLPYEDEPSVTKHLAHFLQQAGQFENGKGLHYVLFNGGAMKPALFQQAIEKVLQRWFPNQSIQTLSSVSLDLAVARGAAYYGKVRRGLGVSIGGGIPRTYYLEIEVKQADGQYERQALTLLPRGTEEGVSFQPDYVFALRPNTPVSFHLLTSHVRLHDQQGDLISIDEQTMHRLPPIHTILRFGRKQTEEQVSIPVKIGIQLTSIGTVELWLQSIKTEHRWQLEFQLRSAAGQENSLLAIQQRQKDETFDRTYLKEAQEVLLTLFKAEENRLKPSQIMEILEEKLGVDRREWPPSVLRGLYETLSKVAGNRKKSSEHETRWWNLAGFFLRPGFGFPLDDFRIKELWKVILSDLKTPKSVDCQIQMWICYRRIAGGLNKGQQVQLASEMTSHLFSKRTGQIEVRSRSDLYAYSEKIRALAALERLEIPFKVRLGESLIKRMEQKVASACDYWALGRIGARHLAYASAGQVVPRDICAQWVEKLLQMPHIEKEDLHFMLVQLARRTDQRELNLPDALIQRIIASESDTDLQERLLHEHSLTLTEQEQIFGDRLPIGLILDKNSTIS